MDSTDTQNAGIQLITENWSRNQQWAGTHETSEPISTTLNLRSLAFKEPEPSEKEVSAMLNAAVGPEGFAVALPDDAKAGASNIQRLWNIEFESVDARESFVDKMEQFRESAQSTVVDPAQLDARKTGRAQEAQLSL